MKSSTASCPSHITGFFEICREHADLLRQGSRGAGVCLAKGVETEVELLDTDGRELTVYVNGRKVENAPVTCWVVDRILHDGEISASLRVNHSVDVPIGSGYGTSGAGALSLTSALNKLFDLELTPVEMAWMAHQAEVHCQTGLGTVAGQFQGGFEVRVEPGAPGVGRTESLKVDEDFAVVSLCLGPLDTPSVLSHDRVLSRVNGIAASYVNHVVNDPRPATFMELSKKFTHNTSLATPRIRETLESIPEGRFTFAMAMMGETIFTVAPSDEAEDAIEALTDASTYRDGALVVSQVASAGVQLQ